MLIMKFGSHGFGTTTLHCLQPPFPPSPCMSKEILTIKYFQVADTSDIQTVKPLKKKDHLLASTLHHFVDFALDVELRMFGFHTFQLNCNLLSGSNISS